MSVEDLAKQAADSVRQVIAEAQKQAAEIISAAEKEAEGIRARAQAEARDQVEGAKRALEELTARFGQQSSSPQQAAPPPTPEPPPPPPGPPTPEPAEATTEPEPTAAPASASDDSQAARLVAMKMALDGVFRDEIDAELEKSYSLADRAALVDEVLAKAGK